MADVQKVTLGVVGWDGVAAGHFAPVVMPDSPTGLDGLQNDVETGKASVLAVMADEKRIGSVLVRILSGGDGLHFVIECANADLPGFDLVETCMPALEGWAKKLGCVAVDVPTHRAGLVFKMKRRNYQVVQTVLRKAIS
ncbi:hypothetical protein ACTU44_13115 [Thalassospira sp. SM2505]